MARRRRPGDAAAGAHSVSWRPDSVGGRQVHDGFRSISTPPLQIPSSAA